MRGSPLDAAEEAALAGDSAEDTIDLVSVLEGDDSPLDAAEAALAGGSVAGAVDLFRFLEAEEPRVRPPATAKKAPAKRGPGPGAAGAAVAKKPRVDPEPALSLSDRGAASRGANASGVPGHFAAAWGLDSGAWAAPQASPKRTSRKNVRPERRASPAGAKRTSMKSYRD
jgi:hypothetical protein